MAEYGAVQILFLILYIVHGDCEVLDSSLPPVGVSFCHSPVRTPSSDGPCQSPPRQALQSHSQSERDIPDLINVALTWGLAKITSGQGKR